MPTTRQQKKHTTQPKKPLNFVQPPKLKSTIKRTLSDPNLNLNTASCTKQAHTLSQPLPDKEISRASTPEHTHNTSILEETGSPTKTDSPATTREANNRQDNDPLTKYPNSYGITLNSQPNPINLLNEQPTATTTTTTNTVTATTTTTTTVTEDNQQPQDTTTNQTHTEDQDAPVDELVLGTQQSPKSKIQPKHAAPTDHNTHDPTSLRNELFSLKTKQAKALHHLNFLRSAIDNNVIPKGFLIQITPQVMDAQDTDIHEAWNDTLIDTSKHLVTITHEHYSLLLATLNEKIEALEALLDKLNIDQRTTQEQQTRLTNLRTKLGDTREKKLDRLIKPSTMQVSTSRDNRRNSFFPETQKHQRKNNPHQAQAPRRPRRTLLPTPPYPPPYLRRPQLIPDYHPRIEEPQYQTSRPQPPPLMSLPPVELPPHLQPHPRPWYYHAEPRPFLF